MFFAPLEALLDSKDEEVLNEALWGLVSLTEIKEAELGSFMGRPLVTKLLHCASCEKTAVRYPALRVLGALCADTDVVTILVVELGILDVLAKILKGPLPTDTVEEICMTIFNVSATYQRKIIGQMVASLGPFICGVLAKPGSVSERVSTLSEVNRQRNT